MKMYQYVFYLLHSHNIYCELLNSINLPEAIKREIYVKITETFQEIGINKNTNTVGLLYETIF